jgi:hypothetical protein
VADGRWQTGAAIGPTPAAGVSGLGPPMLLSVAIVACFALPAARPASEDRSIGPLQAGLDSRLPVAATIGALLGSAATDIAKFGAR